MLTFIMLFLSYASPDRAAVDSARREMLAAGCRVWMDRYSIRPGRDWWREIETGIDKADYVVVFASPALHHSEWTRRELHRAIRKGKRVLVVQIAPSDVPLGIEGLQLIDGAELRGLCLGKR